MLSKQDLMRNQDPYYQAVLFIDVVLFISYGEIIILTHIIIILEHSHMTIP